VGKILDPHYLLDKEGIQGFKITIPWASHDWERCNCCFCEHSLRASCVQSSPKLRSSVWLLDTCVVHRRFLSRSRTRVAHRGCFPAGNDHDICAILPCSFAASRGTFNGWVRARLHGKIFLCFHAGCNFDTCPREPELPHRNHRFP